MLSDIISNITKYINDDDVLGLVSSEEKTNKIKLYPDNSVTDYLPILDLAIRSKSFADHHIDSFNDLLDRGINQIITQNFKLDRDIGTEKVHGDMVDHINYKVTFSNVKFESPTYSSHVNEKKHAFMPNKACYMDKTYTCPVYIDIHVDLTAYNKDGSIDTNNGVIKNHKICELPLMVKSKLCNTYNLPNESLKYYNEDISNLGGYFIVKGVEWAINSVENVVMNKPRLHYNLGHDDEIARCEFISKPGDNYENSSQIIIKVKSRDRIIIMLNRDPMKDVDIPFYLFYRAMGWTNDKQINDSIIDVDYLTKNEVEMEISKSYKASYNKFQNAIDIRNKDDAIVAIMKVMIEEKPKSFQYITENLDSPEGRTRLIAKWESWTDVNFLPHVGLSKAHTDRKLRYLSLLFNKLLQVRLQKIPNTDRDSMKDKRVHAPGISYAKAFKSVFHASVIDDINGEIIKAGMHTDFKEIDVENIIKNIFYGVKFDKAMSQVLTKSSKTVNISGRGSKNNKTINNRMTTQQLGRKNNLKVISILSQISVNNTTNFTQSGARSKQLRQVHPTYLGVICPIRTAEGKSVGMVKQKTPSCIITNSGIGSIIRDYIENLAVEPSDNMPSDSFILEGLDGYYISKYRLNNVYVNGDWIGYTPNPIRLAIKLRKARRENKIDRWVTIYWDENLNELQLFTDPGRLCRPLIRVYNNEDNPEMFKGKEFQQATLVTPELIKAIINSEVTMGWLIENGVIEYLSVGECENMLIAPEVAFVNAHKNDDLKIYTHCDIPQAMMGISALTCPLANHSQAPRVTFQTGQAIQTCGYYTMNYPYRIDRDTFLQYNVEYPMVKTLSNKYLMPNGMNCIVAIAIYSGYNQEDSLIFNRDSLDKGLFFGSKLTYFHSILEDSKEHFDNPKTAGTEGLKTGANYDKLNKFGFVDEGTIVNKGDIIIGKTLEKDSRGKKVYIDKSTIYSSSEPGYVCNVIRGSDDNKSYIKVQIRKSRIPTVGDKFSSRAGQKGILSATLAATDMFSTADGMKPDIIMNPHAFPSRMTFNQPYEVLLATLGINKGSFIDGTIFQPIDLNTITKAMKKMDMDEFGERWVYSGMTGEWIKTKIFMGPTFFQRLQKFVNDQKYAVSKALKDAITFQPLEGRGLMGGLRIGEMERDVILAHGSSRFLGEKMNEDSDGFYSYYCKNCGNQAIVNHKNGTQFCKFCKDQANITELPTCRASIILRDEINGCGIGTKVMMKPASFPEYE